MTTLVKIHSNFKTIAASHAMIGAFEYGDIWNIATSGTINYPLLFVSPEGSVGRKGEVGYKYRVFTMDRVEKGKDNEVDAASDTHQILLDVLTELYKGGQDPSSGDYAFELKLNDISITDFTEKFDDEVCGHFCDITLWAEWPLDRCAIPT